jgi:hypothetical protein
LKACLSSAFFIPSALVPKSFTLFLSKNPVSASSIAKLSPVCPHKFGSILSGFSNFMIFFMVSIVSGSMYILSAIFLSVIIVAGFEFIRITSIPSFFNSLQA